MRKAEETTEFDELLNDVEMQVAKGNFSRIIRGLSDIWAYGAGDTASSSSKDNEVI